jgi:hypothetical protein
VHARRFRATSPGDEMHQLPRSKAAAGRAAAAFSVVRYPLSCTAE